LKEEKKEHYSEKLVREKNELVDAVAAVLMFHDSLSRLENSAYRGDAQREVDERRAEWEEKLERVKPYLKERK
jgi:transcription elongation GreA/GreB family factor